MSGKPPVGGVSRKSAIFRVVLPTLLMLCSSLVVFAVLELGIRILRGEVLSTHNLIVGPASQQRTKFFVRDPNLGWALRPGARVTGADIGWERDIGIPGTYQDAVLTALDSGLRSNGQQAPPLERPVVLAVGDSFTFGGKVSDQQSWPAALERLLGVPVLNGGVSGYGIDQTVLRGEQLAARHRPDLLIVSYINEDLERATSSSRNRVAKPYFRVNGEELELHNTPVPPDPEMDLFRRVFGHSHLVDWIMLKVDWLYWREGRFSLTHEDEEAIGCGLMARLGDLQDRLGLPVVVLLQKSKAEEPPEPQGDRVLACARARGLATMDLFPVLRELQVEDPERHAALFFGHMTPAGNEWVARVLADEIKKRGWLDEG
jgi:hypothetical protein